MPPEKEADSFLEDFKPPQDKTIDDVFGVEAPAAIEKPVVVEPEADEKEFKNRRMRRMEEKYQAEREANIALNARVQALSEAQQFRKDTNADELDSDLSRIYGTDTPQGKEATRILQSVLDKNTKAAEDRAYERFVNSQQESEGERIKEERTIDAELESLEEDFNIDLTSNQPSARKARTELLDLVERLSPKDGQGNIVEFADFGAAFELYQSKKGSDNTQRKDLGSRSMVRSGQSSSTKLESDAAEAYLKSIGII